MKKLTASILGVVAFFMSAGHAGDAAKKSGRQVIVPDAWKSAYESLHYAPAVRAGDMLVLSGVVAGLRDGETDADQEAAFARAFEAIGMILEEAGADWDDVIEISPIIPTCRRRSGPLAASRTAISTSRIRHGPPLTLIVSIPTAVWSRSRSRLISANNDESRQNYCGRS